jgi:hypothetical protein
MLCKRGTTMHSSGCASGPHRDDGSGTTDSRRVTLHPPETVVRGLRPNAMLTGIALQQDACLSHSQTPRTACLLIMQSCSGPRASRVMCLMVDIQGVHSLPCSLHKSADLGRLHVKRECASDSAHCRVPCCKGHLSYLLPSPTLASQ